MDTNNTLILDNAALVPGLFRLRLRPPEGYPRPEPGQFVCLYLNDAGRLLPRPFGVCDYSPDGTLTLAYAVVGAGTKALSAYPAGTELRVSAPQGKGFRTEGFASCVLVGGGAGIPPLLYLAKALQGRVPVRAVLGFRGKPFLLDEFPCPVEIATDDGSAGFRGNAVELLNRSGAGDACVCACGPEPMLRALAETSDAAHLQAALERRMGCGYGACLACVCQTKTGRRKVCEDGPVFNLREVEWNG
jgi:dihydroorotate dehydrogenase electron transfer subunit